ncbi:conserved phage C-terminal domain-containing protein [Cedecea davisae]|uniref:conserved phage C-terminal domain-containing protein n=1 Tax=Cedecea davisae TaxID=158484 RepID=UPI001D0B8225|nr:conserved phage C-terminal domain-containing protein [Cedecea davisae]
MSALIQLLDRPIAYQPSFAQLRVGKVKAGPAAAVLLSQFVYWHNRMDGSWIYKTQAEIKRETGLSRDEQETARRRLVALGVVEEELRGVPATLHYRVNPERLEELLLLSVQQTRQIAATPQTRLRHSPKPDCGNSPNKNAASPQTSLREPTQQACGDPTNFLSGDYTESTQRDCQADELPDDIDDPALRVLTHLNQTTGARFQNGQTTMGFVNGLLVGEYVADELMLVIDHRTELWGADSKMSQYLTPKTLFNFENFEGYLPLARKWDEDGRPSTREPEIDAQERDSAYSRFMRRGVVNMPKSALEIVVRKLASPAGVKGQSPELSKRTWDRLWMENAKAMQAEPRKS